MNKNIERLVALTEEKPDPKNAKVMRKHNEKMAKEIREFENNRTPDDGDNAEMLGS